MNDPEIMKWYHVGSPLGRSGQEAFGFYFFVEKLPDGSDAWWMAFRSPTEVHLRRITRDQTKMILDQSARGGTERETIRAILRNPKDEERSPDSPIIKGERERIRFFWNPINERQAIQDIVPEFYLLTRDGKHYLGHRSNNAFHLARINLQLFENLKAEIMANWTLLGIEHCLEGQQVIHPEENWILPEGVHWNERVVRSKMRGKKIPINKVKLTGPPWDWRNRYGRNRNWDEN